MCRNIYINTLKGNGILLPKLFWPTVRKNCSSDWEKLLKFNAEDWEFLRSSEQFLVTECFFNLFLEVFRSNELEQLEIKLEEIIGT